MLRLIPISFLTVCCFLIQGAIAQSQTDTLSYKLGETVISLGDSTAPRLETTQTLTTVHTLEAKDLNKSNAKNVAEAVKSLPGVTVKDYGGLGGLKTVSLRSLGANHTGVMVDGIAVPDIQSGQIDLGRFGLDNLQAVEIHNQHYFSPPQTARSLAYAGSVNLVSANSTAPTQPLNLNARLQTGSFGQVEGGLGFVKKQGKRSFWGINGNISHANGEYPFLLENGNHQSEVNRKNSDISWFRIEGDYGIDFNDSTQLRAKIYYYDAERGLPGVVILYNEHSAQRLWNRDFFGQLKFTKQLKKNWSLLSVTKVSSAYTRYVDPDFLNTTGGLDDRFQQWEYYVSTGLSKRHSKHLTTFGAVDYFVNTLWGNQTNFPQPVRHNLLGSLGFIGKLHKFRLEGSLLSNYITESTASDASAPEKYRLTPTLAFGYKPFWGKELRLRIAYKEAYRLPTFNDLYYIRVGNTNLKPELARQFSAGIAYAKEDWGILETLQLQADAFHYRIRDKIIAIPTQDLFIWSVQNLGKVVTNGLELFAKASLKPIKKITPSLHFSYTLQNALDRTDPNSPFYGHQISYTPHETVAYGLGFEGKRWAFNWNGLYAGFSYALPENLAENVIPAWGTQDINFSYKLPLKQGKMTFRAELNNCFNQQYQVVKGFPMPGRNWRLGIQWNY